MLTYILSSHARKHMYTHAYRCIHFSDSTGEITDSVPCSGIHEPIPLNKHTLSSLFQHLEDEWRGLCTERVIWLLLGGNREQVVLVGSQNHLIWSSGRSYSGQMCFWWVYLKLIKIFSTPLDFLALLQPGGGDYNLDNKKDLIWPDL